MKSMKKQIEARRAQQYVYDHSEAGRARRQRYNTGAAGKARNDRMRVKRRNEPKYADYRAKKLVDDRRNHFFRYGRLLDEMMTRRPWLRNNYTASKVFTRITGMEMNKSGAVRHIDFTQPRTKKRTARIDGSESALDTFSRITGISLDGGT
jgi:hypothetical protein